MDTDKQILHNNYTSSRSLQIHNAVDKIFLAASNWPILSSTIISFAIAPISILLHRAYVDTGYQLQQPLGVFDIMYGIYISSLIIVSIQNKLYAVKAAYAIIVAADAKTAKLVGVPPETDIAHGATLTITEAMYASQTSTPKIQDTLQPILLSKMDAFATIDIIMRVQTEHVMRNTALYLLLIYHLFVQPIFDDQGTSFTANLFNRAAVILIHTILLMVVYGSDNETHKHATLAYKYNTAASQFIFKKQAQAPKYATY